MFTGDDIVRWKGVEETDFYYENATHCRGCGRVTAAPIMTLAFAKPRLGWRIDYWRRSLRRWWRFRSFPFDKDDCPVCALRRPKELFGSTITNDRNWPRGKPRPLP